MKRKKRALSLVLALALCLSLAMPASAAGGSRFKDVPDNAWYAKAVNTLADGGVLVGRGNGMFAPNEPVTLAELSVVVFRIRGWSDTYNEYHWAGSSMNMCGLGYDTEAGYSTTFPYANDPAYRGDAVTALSDMALIDYESKYLETHPGARWEDAFAAAMAHMDEFDLNSIGDRSAYYAFTSSTLEFAGTVEHYYDKNGHLIFAEAIDMAYQFGLITGIDSNRTCNATGTLTRAELAQMCYNMGWTTFGCVEYE